MGILRVLREIRDTLLRIEQLLKKSPVNEVKVLGVDDDVMFTKQIKDHLNDGWEPVGGVAYYGNLGAKLLVLKK